MPSSAFWGFQHLNANIIGAVQIDMTGPDLGIHELVEVTVMPLDVNLEPHPELLMFSLKIKPNDIDAINWSKCRLTRVEIADSILKSPDSMKASDMFVEWFDNMQLNFRKQIIPIGFDYPRARHVLIEWLGYKEYSRIFSENYRDVRVAANFVNDYHAVRGEVVPFAKQDLRWICKQLRIEVVDHGGACTSDCMNLARAYKRMLQSGYAAL